MPNTREKLIELQKNAGKGFYQFCQKCGECDSCPYNKYGDDCVLAYEADHLIANGVTVQKWIPVTERLPEKDGHYLCNYHFGEYPKMTFTQVLDYYATDIVPHFQHTLGDGSMKVTHWMEIPPCPEPPKGE